MLLESSFDWITLPKYYLGMTCLLLLSIVFILFFTDETRPVGWLKHLDTVRHWPIFYGVNLDKEKSEEIELESSEKLHPEEQENIQLTPWTILKCLLKGFSAFVHTRI